MPDTVRNLMFDPSWIGVGGTLVNDGAGSIERSTEQVHHLGGGSLKAVKDPSLGGGFNAYDSDTSRWPIVPANTEFSFTAWVYSATSELPYAANVNIHDDDYTYIRTVSSSFMDIPQGIWTRVIITGTTESDIDCALMPFVNEYGSDTPGSSVFYTTDWRLSIGENDGWAYPPRLPLISGHYDAFLSLVQFNPPDSQGDLMMIYRQGESHVGAGDYGKVMKRRSTDQGLTWTTPAVEIKSEAGVDLRTDCAGGLTPTGRLIAVYSRYNPDTVEYLSINFIYSDDEGDTWSAQGTIGHGTTDVFAPHGPMIAIDDSKLLQGWYGSTGAGKFQSYIATSDDDGASWSAGTLVLANAGKDYTESSYVYLGDGNIVGLIREEASSGDPPYTYRQVKSVNNGVSWTDQGETSFDSWLIPSPPTLSDGGSVIACHYVNRDDGEAYVVHADPDALLTGPDAWGARVLLDAQDQIGTDDSGYIGVVHPFGDQRAFGAGYAGPRIFFFDSPDPGPFLKGPEGLEYFDGRGYFYDGVWSTDSGKENCLWTGTVDGSPSDYYPDGTGISAPVEQVLVHAAGRGQ